MVAVVKLTERGDCRPSHFFCRQLIQTATALKTKRRKLEVDTPPAALEHQGARARVHQPFTVGFDPRWTAARQLHRPGGPPFALHCFCMLTSAGTPLPPPSGHPTYLAATLDRVLSQPGQRGLMAAREASVGGRPAKKQNLATLTTRPSRHVLGTTRSSKTEEKNGAGRGSDVSRDYARLCSAVAVGLHVSVITDTLSERPGRRTWTGRQASTLSDRMPQHTPPTQPPATGSKLQKARRVVAGQLALQPKQTHRHLGPGGGGSRGVSP